MTTNAMSPVVTLVSKLPAGNPIEMAYSAALEIQSGYAARGKLAWRSRRSAKPAKASGKTAHKAK